MSKAETGLQHTISHNKKLTKISTLVPVMGAAIVAFITCGFLGFSVFNYGSGYDINILLFGFFVTAFWMICFWRTISQTQKGSYSKKEIAQISVTLLLLALILVKFVWGSSYLQLDVLGATASGTIIRDTLFHASISESIKNYGFPSFLFNSAGFLDYHSMSHAVVAFISKIVNVPSFMGYNYLFPMLSLPLYTYLIFSVAAELKFFFKSKNKLSFGDAVIVLCVVAGILPEPWQSSLALWNSSNIISESQLVAVSFALVFAKVLLYVNRRNLFKNKAFKIVFLLLINPVFIVLAVTSKISVGFCLILGLMYYFFRLHTKQLRYWVLNIYYFLIFILLYIGPKMIESPYAAHMEPTSFYPFHFIRLYVNNSLGLFHVFFLFLFAIVVVLLRLAPIKSIKQWLLSKDHIWEEMLVLICLASFVAANITPIGGGSGWYFIYPQQLMAVLLLIGYGAPDLLAKKYHAAKGGTKAGTKIMAIMLCIVLLYNTNYKASQKSAFFDIITPRYYNSSIYNENTNALILSQLKSGNVLKAGYTFLKVSFSPSAHVEDNFYQNIKEINEITEGKKADYYLFVGDDAESWKRFEERSLLHVYPALTGIVTIGTVYSVDGVPYNQNGTVCSSPFYKPNNSDVKMNLESAIEKTRQDGRPFLIYYNGYVEIIKV